MPIAETVVSAPSTNLLPSSIKHQLWIQPAYLELDH